MNAESDCIVPEKQESSARIVWTLAWPAVALNSLQVVNTLLDRSFIGQLPTSSMTAHGASLNVMFFMFSVAMAIATGATAIVSRAYGARDRDQVREASKQSLNIAWIAGLVIAGITVAFGPKLGHLVLPAKDTEALQEMSKFIVMYGCGLPAIFVIQSLAASLRGIGDTKSPMVISGVQILMHICLNYVFIFKDHSLGPIRFTGLGMGLPGAGAALSLSAWIAAIAYILYCGKTPLGSLWRLGLPAWPWVTRLAKIATPAAGYSILRVLSMTAFTIILAHVPNGSTAIAAMSIGFAVESIMFMPPFGLSVAAGALIGQSLGMEDPDRAERLGWTAAHHGALVTFALSLPIFIFAPELAGVMVGHKEVLVRESADMLRLLCLTEVGFAYAVVLLGALQGAGDTRTPFWISVVGLWGVRVPMAVLLTFAPGDVLFGSLTMPFGFGMGSHGAWIAMSATQAVQGIMGIVSFRRGRWKTIKV